MIYVNYGKLLNLYSLDIATLTWRNKTLFGENMKKLISYLLIVTVSSCGSELTTTSSHSNIKTSERPNSPDSIETAVAKNNSIYANELSPSCIGFENNIKKAGLKVVDKYSCDQGESCLLVWEDRENVEVAGYYDENNQIDVQWEWEPYEAITGWNVMDVAYKTEGWEFTDENYFCAGIVKYAFVDILEDGSLVVKATKETNRAAICPFRKVFSESLSKCSKVR